MIYMPCKNDIRRKFSNTSDKMVYLNDGLTKLKKKKNSSLLNARSRHAAEE